MKIDQEYLKGLLEAFEASKYLTFPPNYKHDVRRLLEMEKIEN